MKSFIACTGLLVGGLVSLVSIPAQAIGFQFTSECINEDGAIGLDVCKEQAGFSTETNKYSNWTADVMLEQVTYGNVTRSDLTLVNRTVIQHNDEHDSSKGRNSGAASADMGDGATIGVSEEHLIGENQYLIANADLNQPSALTNRNLSSIVDTEDKGNFIIDLFFQNAVDNVLLWERGKNSALSIQALDEYGEIYGNVVNLGTPKTGAENFTPLFDAGFKLNTLEISKYQSVGSIGVNKSIFGLAEDEYISGIRLISAGEDYNGPDWKVMGTVDPLYADAEDVPEPFAIAGLVVIGGAIAARRRQN